MSEVKDLHTKLKALREVIAAQDKLIEAQADMIALLKSLRKVETNG